MPLAGWCAGFLSFGGEARERFAAYAHGRFSTKPAADHASLLPRYLLHADLMHQPCLEKELCMRKRFVSLLAVIGAFLLVPSVRAQDTRQPNILVIMGDDIGQTNVSASRRGLLGCTTPNLDRLANEGGVFVNYDGQQSCTAGRAAFILGQSPFRTGLTKVGLPGAPVGIQQEDPTIAEFLKPLGYMTGQVGKKPLGDKDEFLPTNHGVDEFFGNLYHLNAEEEPEPEDYPKAPEFRKRFGPHGVLKATADGKITDTGPLTKKRMETVDEEFLAATKDFIDRSHKANKPFFVWFNSTRMHIFTHRKPASKGKTGLGLQADGMVEHDGHVGELLKQLVLYAQQMHVPRTISDALLAVPPDRGKRLSAAELATHGINARDAGALEERRARSQETGCGFGKLLTC
jgi:arylsulfatase